MVRRRAAVAVLGSLLLAAACTSDDRAGAPTAAPRLDLSGGRVPIPATTVGDLRLAGVTLAEPEQDAPAPVVVIRAHDVVLTVTVRPPEAWPDGTQPVPGPPLADGRPTAELCCGPYHRRPSLGVRAPDSSVVLVTGHDVETEVLAQVLDEVQLPITEPGAVPGTVIGILQEPPPDRIGVRYEGDGGRWAAATIEVATPAQQAALQALVHPDPASSIDPLTEASCCAPGIFEAAREVEVGGRRGTLATLDPYEQILIVEGAPGVVLRNAEAATIDHDLVAIASSLESGTGEDLTTMAEELDQRARDATASTLGAAERALGWEVLERLDIGPTTLVISTGSGPRPLGPEHVIAIDGSSSEPRTCAVSPGDGPASCLPADPSGLQLAREVSEIVFGAAPPGATSAAIVHPGGEVPIELVRLDDRPGVPPQVLVAYLSTNELADLTLGFTREVMTDIAVVVRDATGVEMARAPLYQR